MDNALNVYRGQALSPTGLPVRVALTKTQSTYGSLSPTAGGGRKAVDPEFVDFIDSAEMEQEALRLGRGYEDDLIDRIDRQRSGRSSD